MSEKTILSDEKKEENNEEKKEVKDELEIQKVELPPDFEAEPEIIELSKEEKTRMDILKNYIDSKIKEDNEKEKEVDVKTTRKRAKSAVDKYTLKDKKTRFEDGLEYKEEPEEEEEDVEEEDEEDEDVEEDVEEEEEEPEEPQYFRIPQKYTRPPKQPVVQSEKRLPRSLFTNKRELIPERYPPIPSTPKKVVKKSRERTEVAKRFGAKIHFV